MPADSENVNESQTSADEIDPSVSRRVLLTQVDGLLRQAAACEQELCVDAVQATEDAQQIERIRRLATVLAVETMHDIAESRVCDEHGYASSKVLYEAANSQSSRDVYGLEQVRKLFNRCAKVLAVARTGRLSGDHLRLLARAYANKRVRKTFIDHQSWLLAKAKRFDFKGFEIILARWIEVHDDSGSDPNTAHQNRNATMNNDLFGGNWQTHSTNGLLVGSVMHEIFIAYIEAEFSKDWEDAKTIHGDKTCIDHLARTQSQRNADAMAQIFADAAANPNTSTGFNIVHNVVWSESTYEEMARRHAGHKPQPFDLDEFRCETTNGVQLEPNEAFLDSLMNPLRRVVVNAKKVVIDISEKRFFTGLARTALQISYPECDWPGCHVPGTKCQGDHITPKNRGGPTTQTNGTLFCGKHNRHKERGYTVWRDPTTGQIRIKTPTGHEITTPWETGADTTRDQPSNRTRAGRHRT